MGTISNNSLPPYVNTLFESQFQSPEADKPFTSSGSASGNASQPQASDGGELSPLAALMSTLQGLLETDPTRYSQLTGQIAKNLLNAAQAAQDSGDTVTANRLTVLASAFTIASQSGQLPQFQNSNQDSGGHSGNLYQQIASIVSDADKEKSSAAAAGARSILNAPISQNTGSSADLVARIMSTLTNAGVPST